MGQLGDHDKREMYCDAHERRPPYKACLCCHSCCWPTQVLEKLLSRAPATVVRILGQQNYNSSMVELHGKLQSSTFTLQVWWVVPRSRVLWRGLFKLHCCTAVERVFCIVSCSSVSWCWFVRRLHTAFWRQLCWLCFLNSTMCFEGHTTYNPSITSRCKNLPFHSRIEL